MRNDEWLELAVEHKKQADEMLSKNFEESVSQEAEAEWALDHVVCPNCEEHGALQFISGHHVGCMACCEVVC